MTLRVIKDGGYNPDMLKIAYRLRGYSIREIAKIVNVKPRVFSQWLSGVEPSTEQIGKLCEVLDFPRAYFYRSGVCYEPDPRYPPDMFVPLPLRPLPTRADVMALIDLIPEREIPALYEYMHDIAAYGDKVFRLDHLMEGGAGVTE